MWPWSISAIMADASRQNLELLEMIYGPRRRRVAAYAPPPRISYARANWEMAAIVICIAIGIAAVIVG